MPKSAKKTQKKLGDFYATSKSIVKPFQSKKEQSGVKWRKPKPDRPPTTFELSVYKLCRKVPAGKVTTYGNIGKALGCKSAQAVGNAMRNNPYGCADMP